MLQVSYSMNGSMLEPAMRQLEKQEVRKAKWMPGEKTEDVLSPINDPSTGLVKKRRSSKNVVEAGESK